MAWTKENMPSFTPDIEGRPTEGLWTPTSTQYHRLGARYTDGLSRVYRYVKNGGTELAAGAMTAAEATHTNVKDITQSGYTTAIGDERIRVLATTSNAILDDELLDGWLTIHSSTGLGYSYAIAGNKWISGDTVMDIQLYEPIRVATAATAVITLTKCRYRDINVVATTPTAVMVGVPMQVIAANYYGWVQTRGPCAVLVDDGETIKVGCEVGLPATSADAGSVGVAAITESIWGTCIEYVAADSYALIDLRLE
jgi:hypothetical protein